MRSSQIREIFFSFFREKGHYKVLSAPLVPAKDPTILFTNAGMNQFKDVFMGNEKRDYSRAVSIQKCLRVSGKHNDFDEVGRTQYHHTFFEMLGNFSFGDYFKEQAIEMAWELMTEKFGFSPDSLRVSVYKEDEDAFRIWNRNIGIAAERIARLGEKDNFWQMGNTGPCGPCSEIHFDRGKEFGPDEFSDENKRFVEVWNLVFMQYYRDESGNLTPLPAPSIDTGMGMERLAALLSGKTSNYDTDLFRPIIEFTAEMARINPDDPGVKVGLNVIADHIRALSFLISDGVIPANEGRGYILRRLLRRASRHGRAIGFDGSFLFRIVPVVASIMNDAYPELELNRTFITEVIMAEEERFERTLLSGLKKFDEVLQESAARGATVIPGKDVFRLSDTYGFPLDFSIDLARENNIEVDIEGFNRELSAQQEKSRSVAPRKSVRDLPEEMDTAVSAFTGYDNLEQETEILGIFRDNRSCESLKEGEEGVLVLKQTPFYAESGGQTGDTGTGKSDSALFAVNNTLKNRAGGHLHDIQVQKGILQSGTTVRVKVDPSRRENTAVHHTSTHLLHAALREVLGPHVKQSGSYVGPDKLRFDFTHFKSLSKEQIRSIERMINSKIREDLYVTTNETTYEDAVGRGAIAIFDEKYSDRVRMVTMGNFSSELCGGTHLERTGSIGFFKVVSESSIASGIRRIEAVAGASGYEYITSLLMSLEKLETRFRLKGEKLVGFLEDLDEKNRKLEKELKSGKSGEAPDLSGIIKREKIINGVKVLIYHIDGVDRKVLSAKADELKRECGCPVVLSSNEGDHSVIVMSIPENLTKKFNAGMLIRQIASIVEGNGGGRPDFAQAGGGRIDNPGEFQASVEALIEGMK